MPYLRAAALAVTLLAFYALALVLAPFAKSRPWLRAKVAQPFHRSVCRAMGLRVTLHGLPLSPGPHLVVANHASWSDILVLGSVLPVTFVARHDMAGWPLFGYLARFQNTIFVDRKRLRALPGVNAEITRRLVAGENVVLFAEATTGDGTRLLPFHSPHFQAALDAAVRDQARPLSPSLDGERVGVRGRAEGLDIENYGPAPDPSFSAGRPLPAKGWGEGVTPCIQPAAIRYARRNGLPLGKAGRAEIAWYGELTLAPHLWRLLKGGPVDCEVTLGEVIGVAPGANRKALCADTRRAVRALSQPKRPGTAAPAPQLAYSHSGQKALHVGGVAAAPATRAQNVTQDG